MDCDARVSAQRLRSRGRAAVGWTLVAVLLVAAGCSTPSPSRAVVAVDEAPASAASATTVDVAAPAVTPGVAAAAERVIPEVAAAPASVPEAGSEPAKLPRLVDLGASTCIPCKEMAPILEELGRTHTAYFEVVFIDVRKTPSEAREYGIRVIPTQIFYDADGRELYRHVGFYSKAQILAKWRALGIDVGS